MFTTNRFWLSNGAAATILVALVVLIALSFSTGAAFANGYEENPPRLAWSPAENLLAAVVNDELWLIRDQSYADVVSSGAVASPTFSQDGRYLAFVQGGNVNLYDTDSRETKVVDDSGEAVDCTFDCVEPEGTLTHKLYFTAGPLYYGCDIYMYDVDNGQLYTVTDEGEASASAPVPNPYSDMIAFVLHGIDSPGSYEQLYIKGGEFGRIRAATGPQPAGEWGYHESNPVFIGPNTVVFQRGGWGDWSLYKLDLSTKREEIFLADAEQPSMSSFRNILAFTRRDQYLKEEYEYDWEIPPTVWVKFLDTDEEFQISASNVWAEFPAVSIDGTHIAWIEKGEFDRIVIRSVIDAVG
jgi:hypothetical protein